MTTRTLVPALLACALGAGCAKPPPNNGCADATTLCGPISESMTLTADKTWTLDGDVFVTGGTLTIEPGTKVVSLGGALIIARGGRIDAAGTAAAPIVFTSARPEGEREAGDWKGLVLLGSATINVAGGTQTIEGFASGSDARADYGGDDDAHNCGRVRYVRIEFTGFKLANGNELQGLTIGGCGSDTEIDYVQSHLSTDDGIEIFGGTSDLKHLVITGADDDGLDWDFGWHGKVAFAVVHQWPNRGNNGIEADNNEKDFDAQPRSAPEIWNMTLIGRPTGGSERSVAMLLRRGTAGRLHNMIAINFADDAIDIADKGTADQWAAGSLAIDNSIFFNLKGHTDALPAVPNPKKDTNGTVIDPSDQAQFDESAQIMAAAHHDLYQDAMLSSLVITAPSYAPAPGSPALVPGNAEPLPAWTGETAQFVGAIGATDWTAGWTAYPEN